MWTDADTVFMQQAVRLSLNGRGRVEPNPLVGCVLVKDNIIIAVGHHTAFGRPHAEAEALHSCPVSPVGATAYVTLEPCSHTDKKTPPCVPLLIKSGLARVVVGTLDPNPLVDGRGVALLRAAGIPVDLAVGPVADKCRDLVAPFALRVTEDRPYFTLKWAESADGKVAGPMGQRRKISCPASVRLVHQLRARCDAIVVGVDTVLTDDPLLTARDVDVLRIADRIVIDRQGRLPLDCALVRTARETRTIVITRTLNDSTAYEKQLRAAGVEILLTDDDGDPFAPLLRARHQDGRPYSHVLIESGRTLARAAIQSDFADRIWRFVSPHLIADPITDATDPTAPTAPTAVSIPKTHTATATRPVGVDTLTEYLFNPDSTHPTLRPTADFSTPD